MNRFVALGLVLPLVALFGCAGGPWTEAVEEDSSAGYYRFIRDHPGSSHLEEAKERLEFHKVRRRPTLENLVRFRELYPDSVLLEQVRPLLEKQAFTSARLAGTAEAYRDFVREFPDASLAPRAAGNAAYFEARGFVGDAEGLAAFADAHPESDFAAEARRSVESVAVHAQSRFDRVGLVIELSPSVSMGGCPGSIQNLPATLHSPTDLRRCSWCSLGWFFSIQASNSSLVRSVG